MSTPPRELIDTITAYRNRRKWYAYKDGVYNSINQDMWIYSKFEVAVKKMMMSEHGIVYIIRYREPHPSEYSTEEFGSWLIPSNFFDKQQVCKRYFNSIYVRGDYLDVIGNIIQTLGISGINLIKN